ncbi:S41 family peptidase [Oscillospiraceae bacterium MB08-C2-2]|nr:S41 family peptidase [Oscillospiraceae bacterium MB08-C2-2]
MRKIKLVQLTAFFMALLLLCSCSADWKQQWSLASRVPEESESSLSSSEPEETFQYSLDQRLPSILRQQIIASRRQVFAPIDDAVKKQVELYLTPDLELETDLQIARSLTEGVGSFDEAVLEMPKKLSHAEAKEEIEFLFSYLKYGYCGYGYLGGDAVFNTAKEKMLAALAQQKDPVDLFTYKYDILIEFLEPIIVDSHFVVDSESFSTAHTHRYYSFNEELLFEQEGNEFITTLDGTRLTLTAVEGKPPEEFLRLILTQEGTPAWAIGITHVEPGEYSSLTLTLRNENGDPLEHSLPLQQADTEYTKALRKQSAGYNRYEREGISILENRRLYAEDNDPLNDADPQLTAFTEEAATLSTEPVLILDLRGNPGGNDSYAFKWIQNYAGLFEPGNYASINVSLLTNTVYQSAGWIRTWLEDMFYEADQEGRIPGWTDVLYGSAKLVPNENVVFVLIDSGVASSAETFVAALQEMENVIIVGTSTSGMGTMGNIREIYLPKSRLCITCGFSLFLTPDLSPFEGKGYAPDLWAPPGESLERVLRFAANYELSQP